MKAVVVGTSHGARVQVPALRAGGFEVAALVGRDPARTARRAERLGIPRACGSLPDALADGEIDLVAIATPPDTHLLLTLEALAAGCHVLCEKPLALSLAEAQEMVVAARECKKVAVVGNEFRFRDARAAAQVAIDEGRIGTPVFVDLVDSTSLLVEQASALPDWFLETDRGGGWLGSSGSHAIDQALAWAGPVRAVSARFHQWPGRRGGDSEDAFTAVLNYDSGADGLIQESGAAFGPRFRVERIVGDRGTLLIEQETVMLFDEHGTREVRPPVLPFAGSDGDLDDPRDEFAHLRPFARMAVRLREAIAGKQAVAPRLPTFEDGLRVIDVMQALRDSARRGGEVVTTSVAATRPS